MKKYLSPIFALLPFILCAQSSWDVYQLQQTELRGTARYMAMAGAFTSLGGDLSTLEQNPGGVGVYRSNDVGVTINLDFLNSNADGYTTNRTKFHCNNFGYVGAFKLDGSVMRNVNIGITYNRQNFNRHYKGRVDGIGYSLSNYIAGETNGSFWLPTLADKLHINYLDPTSSAKEPHMLGLYGAGTTGYGEFEVLEQGGVNTGNFTLGGNVKDLVYWGVSFTVNSLHYDTYRYYGDALNDAYINEKDKRGDASYGFEHSRETNGTGWNFKAGVIITPVNFLRLGFAIHTPTFYKLTDDYSHVAAAKIGENPEEKVGSEISSVAYRLNTPLRFMAGVGVVITKYCIISADYEYQATNKMTIRDPSGDSRTWSDFNSDISTYFQPTHIWRIGGEVRPIPELSVRLGYQQQGSAVKQSIRNDILPGTDGSIYTDMDHTASYTVDNGVKYFCAGLGYRTRNIYVDLAFVHRRISSTYHGFSATPASPFSPSCPVTSTDNNIALTVGARF